MHQRGIISNQHFGIRYYFIYIYDIVCRKLNYLYNSYNRLLTVALSSFINISIASTEIKRYFYK